MRLIIALFLPWIVFFTIKRPIAGVICLLLQLTILGWIPATIWAVYSLSQYKTDKKIEAALKNVSQTTQPQGHNRKRLRQRPRAAASC